MSGGPFDSSLTRVQPILKALERSGGAGWVREFLALGSRAAEVDVRGFVEGTATCAFEVQVPPPRPLLGYYIDNPGRLRWPMVNGRPKRFGPDAEQLRKDLLAGSPAAASEAHALLSKKGYQRGARWCFEGFTSIDARIDCQQVSLFIEGKRTEPHFTGHTEWDPLRDQIARNLDAIDAWESKPPHFLFMVVVEEGTALVEDARQFDSAGLGFARTSMPHRSAEDVERLWTAHYAGFTTWQAVRRRWTWLPLPDRNPEYRGRHGS